VEAVVGAARVGDTPVPLGAPNLRSLLGLLVLWRDQPVAADRLIDLLWRGARPPGAGNTLQGYVAGLRRRLEPGRRACTASSVLLHECGGSLPARTPKRLLVRRDR
jgi:DNA-binding SARP family transcriptional activator